MGPSLWRQRVGGGVGADSGTPAAERLIGVDAATALRGPVALPGRGVAIGQERYPVYGAASQRRDTLLPTDPRLGRGRDAVGYACDLLPDLPGQTTDLTVAPDGNTFALLHSDFGNGFAFWYRLLVVRNGVRTYPLPEDLCIWREPPCWSPDGRLDRGPIPLREHAPRSADCPIARAKSTASGVRPIGHEHGTGCGSTGTLLVDEEDVGLT